MACSCKVAGFAGDAINNASTRIVGFALIVLILKCATLVVSVTRNERVANQGHSKKLSGDDGDRFGAILPEVFASLRHGHAAGADEMEDKVADRCERARS